MAFSASVAEQVAGLVREAARACRADRWRRGSLVELPAEGTVVVAGDLHGNQRNYERLLRIADLANRPDWHLVLQECTHECEPVAERGCRSWQLTEMVARLKAGYPDQAHIILGNHEMAELCGLAIGKNGFDLNERFAAGLDEAYGGSARTVMEAYREFWASLPLGVRAPNGVFVCHSTPRLEKMGPMDLAWFRSEAAEERTRRGPVFDLLWGRDYTVEAAEEFSRRVESEVLVVGHTRCESGYSCPNRRHVILDSKDDAGVCVILPLGRSVTQVDVARSVARLGGGAAECASPGRAPGDMR